MHTKFWWGNLKKRVYLEDPGIDGKIILNRIFKKCDGGHGLDLSGSEKGQVEVSCGCGKETSSSEKGEEFID